MDDREFKRLSEKVAAIEGRWNEISRMRNVFAITPNDNDVIQYNAPLAQWEAGPASGVWPPGTVFNLNRIFRFPINDDPPTQYTKTAANLTTALGASTSGQIVQIHGPCTLAGNFTVPDGVILMALGRLNITLAGQITLGNGAMICNLLISETANDANTIYGVVGPTMGNGYIMYCDVSAVQSGAGNAYAIGAIGGLSFGNGNLIVRHSKLYGSSVGGSGYAGRSTSGIIYSRHNDYYGSTDRWVMA